MTTEAEADAALQQLMNERLPVSSLNDMNFSLSGGRAVFFAGNQASGRQAGAFPTHLRGSRRAR
jgi:hypothetical protein